MLFQKVLADSAQIVEDAQSQCQKGHIIKINAQVVAYIDQKCCQQSVGKEAGDKNPVIKGAREFDTSERKKCLSALENSVVSLSNFSF